MATRMQQRRGTATQWTSSNDGDGPILNAGEIGWESDTNKFKIGDGTSYWADLTYFVDATDVIASSLGSYLQDSDIGAISGVAGLDASKNLLVPGASIIVEGATDNGFETTLTVTDPTADRTITLPDATGTLALTSDITTAINNLVDGAPVALDTLNELAAAINDDESYASTITTALGLKAPLADPTFTGTVTIPTLTLTNPLSASNGGTGLSSLGDGVATFLATPSSANFASMISDEIGTGNVILSELATNTQTESYTLVLGDKAKVVEMNVGSANDLTVPLNASVAYPVGTQIHIVQTGAGQTTVVATGGVTINATPGLKLRAQWSAATLIKRAENTWVLVGDISA